MTQHKTLKYVRCRAVAHASKNFYNKIPLHEREAAIKAELHLLPPFDLAAAAASLRTAAAGKGWKCSPCTLGTCPSNNRGYKGGKEIKAVNWTRVGRPLLHGNKAGFSGLCCPDHTSCTTSQVAKDGTPLGSGGGADKKRGNGAMCMCQCFKCAAQNCAYTKEQGVVMRPHWFVDQSGDVNAPSIIDYYHYEVNIFIPMTAIQAAIAAANAAQRFSKGAAKATERAKVAATKRAAKKAVKRTAKAAKTAAKEAERFANAAERFANAAERFAARPKRTRTPNTPKPLKRQRTDRVIEDARLLFSIAN